MKINIKHVKSVSMNVPYSLSRIRIFLPYANQRFAHVRRILRSINDMFLFFYFVHLTKFSILKSIVSIYIAMEIKTIDRRNCLQLNKINCTEEECRERVRASEVHILFTGWARKANGSAILLLVTEEATLTLKLPRLGANTTTMSLEVRTHIEWSWIGKIEEFL